MLNYKNTVDFLEKKNVKYFPNTLDYIKNNTNYLPFNEDDGDNLKELIDDYHEANYQLEEIKADQPENCKGDEEILEIEDKIEEIILETMKILNRYVRL